MDNQNEIINQINEKRKKIEHTHRDYYYELGKVVVESRKSAFKIIALPITLYKRYKNIVPIKGEFDVEKLDGKDKDEYMTCINDELYRLNQLLKLDSESGQYAFGKEAYLSFVSRKKLITTPYRFIKAYIDLKKSRKVNEKILSSKMFESSSTIGAKIEEASNTILFVATNGAGLGHLTRSLAVARRLRKRNPDLNIIFLTTSLALPIVNRERFLSYCIPSKELIPGISSSQWNKMLKNHLKELFELYPVSTVVFDGATPYASITAAIAEASVDKLWIKRAGDKTSEIVKSRQEKEKYFDFIVVPGEVRQIEKNEDAFHKCVNPVVFLDENELWPRKEVRKYLKIPEDKKLAYIQLGAGNINDINSDIGRIIKEIRKHNDVMMVIGESLIGAELKIIEDDIIVIKDYPNSKYFKGFDFAVSACGYNSFHELIYFEVPTLFIPNMNAKTDDQYARAMKVQNIGGGFVVTDTSNISNEINLLCDEVSNHSMRKKLSQMKFKNGAEEIATIILDRSYR